MPKRTHTYARAPANFALSKYWGKKDPVLRHPAVPSVSVCIDGLFAYAGVCFEQAPGVDLVILGDAPADVGTRARVCAVLDAVRATAGINGAARVKSRTDFPVGAGLASSAAGLAAVAGAAWRAAGLDPADLDGIAGMARLGSGSAARSIHGGFVVWEPTEAGSLVRPLAPATHWPLELCLVQLCRERKAVSSTAGMAHAANTSPIWEAWLTQAPLDAAEIETAVMTRDLPRLAAFAEANCLLMHATTQTARPAQFYMRAETWRVIEKVRALRSGGLPCFFTVDAGPNVKVFTEPGSLAAVTSGLSTVAGPTADILHYRVGGGLSYEALNTP